MFPPFKLKITAILFCNISITKKYAAENGRLSLTAIKIDNKNRIAQILDICVCLSKKPGNSKTEYIALSVNENAYLSFYDK